MSKKLFNDKLEDDWGRGSEAEGVLVSPNISSTVGFGPGFEGKDLLANKSRICSVEAFPLQNPLF